MRNTLKLTALGITLALALASPALAHGNEDHTGPFRVVVKTALPKEAVSASVENGAVTLTVTPGHTVSVLGYDDEEALRIDESGVIWTQPSSMMAQMAEPTATGSSAGASIATTSPMSDVPGMSDPHDTTHMADSESTDVASPSTYAESPESNWQRVGDGGVVLYHEHRCHFMGQHVSQSIADGGIVASFDLPFLVDGVKKSLSGDLVFDPSMNPEKAAELLGGTHDHASGTPTLLLVALTLVALGAGLLLFRKAAATKPDSVDSGTRGSSSELTQASPTSAPATEATHSNSSEQDTPSTND
jgi:hypothetical protein